MTREFTNMAIELCFPPEGADAVLSVGCLPRTWFSIFDVPQVYVSSVLQRLLAFPSVVRSKYFQIEDTAGGILRFLLSVI